MANRSLYKSYENFLTDFHKESFQSLSRLLTKDCQNCMNAFNGKCDAHVIEFHRLKPFINANIPISFLSEDDEVIERDCREFDLVNEKILSPFKGYQKLFTPYIRNISSYVEDNGYSFVFYGFNGSGKTYTALDILSEAVAQRMSGYFLDFKDLVNLYNRSEFSREQDSESLYRYILNCDFLVIDEIGKESSTTDNLVGVFEQVIKKRQNNCKPTILITNILFPSEKEGFFKRYGSSIYNALFNNYRVVEFSKNGDFRVKLRKEWEI